MLLMSCSGLSRAFDRGALFEDLGFELSRGERVGLVGPNGVGKTTLHAHSRPDRTPRRGRRAPARRRPAHASRTARRISRRAALCSRKPGRHSTNFCTPRKK